MEIVSDIREKLAGRVASVDLSRKDAHALRTRAYRLEIPHTRKSRRDPTHTARHRTKGREKTLCLSRSCRRRDICGYLRGSAATKSPCRTTSRRFRRLRTSSNRRGTKFCFFLKKPRRQNAAGQRQMRANLIKKSGRNWTRSAPALLMPEFKQTTKQRKN